MPRRPNEDIPDNLVIRCHSQGMYVGQIARELGTTAQRIERILKRLGITPNKYDRARCGFNPKARNGLTAEEEQKRADATLAAMQSPKNFAKAAKVLGDE